MLRDVIFSGETTGEMRHWSLLGVKGLNKLISIPQPRKKKTLSTRMEDDDDNASEAIQLIAEDKRSTWICEIDVPHVRLEMRHF